MLKPLATFRLPPIGALFAIANNQRPLKHVALTALATVLLGGAIAPQSVSAETVRGIQETS